MSSFDITHPSPRIALVTGSARRLGASIAEYLHQAGFRVAIHYHCSRDEANRLSQTLNQRRKESAAVFSADLTAIKANQTLIDNVIEWAGQIDLLVNNAALFAPSSLETGENSLWNKMFTLNVQSPFWLSIAARASLDAQRGSIINITDIHAEHPLKGYSEYCQTKAALLMQTKALAREFAPNIRVNAIAPGAIAWPEHQNALSAAQQQHIIDKTLLKRHGEPLFIAQAVLALANNPFITGQMLRVDGGRF